MQISGPINRGTREVSTQSTGGPRLGGRPDMAAARTNGKSMPASCWPGWLEINGPPKGGKTNANEPHMSQCAPAGAASPAMSAAVALAVFARQSPPSLPVRTSSASIDAGAISADNTAKKLRKAATRRHKGLTDGDNGWLNTTRIIETPGCTVTKLTVIIQAMPNAAPVPTAENARAAADGALCE